MPLTMQVNGQAITIPDSERTECEVWDRVMGYFRPVDSWNIGKRQEFADRKRYRETIDVARLPMAAS